MAGAITVARSCRNAGIEVSSGRNREIERLEEALVAVFKAGLLDIRLEPPPLTIKVNRRRRQVPSRAGRPRPPSGVTDQRHRIQLGALPRRQIRQPARRFARQNMLVDAFPRPCRAAASPCRTCRAAAEVAMHLKDVARLALLRA